MAPVFRANMTLTAVHLGQNSMGAEGISALTEVLEQGPFKFSVGRYIVRRWMEDPTRVSIPEEFEPMTPEQAELYSDLYVNTPGAESGMDYHS
jgi:hypothetical protein